MVQTIREARELYKAGELELINITAHAERTTESADKISGTNKTWNPDGSTWTHENKGSWIHFNKDPALEINDRLIGPLADPMVFEKFHASLDAELKKAKE